MVNVASLDLELKVPAQKFWGAIRESATLFPTILPSLFKSIETIAGDGKSVGSVRHIKYGEAMQGLTFTKERVDAVDEANMSVTVSVIEGEILGMYKVFVTTLKVLPEGNANSCLVKRIVEYEPAQPGVPPPDMAKEAAVNTFKAIEAHLLAQAA